MSKFDTTCTTAHPTLLLHGVVETGRARRRVQVRYTATISPLSERDRQCTIGFLEEILGDDRDRLCLTGQFQQSRIVIVHAEQEEIITKFTNRRISL